MNTINDPPGIGLRTPFPFHPQSSSSSSSSSSNPTESPLCHLCRNLGSWFVSTWISFAADAEIETEKKKRARSPHGTDDSKYQHHESWTALSESASRDCCPFCYQLALEGEARFMGGTVAYKMQHGQSTAFTAEIIEMHGEGEDARVVFFCDRVIWSMFDVNVLPNDPMVQYGISTLYQPSNPADFALASTLTKGRRWFEECKTAHAECKLKPKFVPTRLLDVGSSPEAPKDLKLIDTRRCGIRGDTNLEYATLSHCWGRTEHITTAIDTQKKREAGIAFSELNRTFQDAVLVTRALGIRYLWIDSLCIIQDSALDWQKESALMGSVYNGAMINIAADAAEDGDQGFLSKRALLSLPYTLMGKSSHGKLFLKASKRHRLVEYSGNLRRRAWVFQEYTLSACSIRYNLNGLVWECRCGCHYDSEVIFEENEIRRAVRDLKKLPLQIKSVSPSPASKMSEIMAIWRKIVSEYSKKELTYETDVLPALSGLASLIQTATGDQYLAGIWRSDLPQALRWVPDSPDWLPSTYLAPTWSWACRKKSSPITYLSSTEVQYKVKVLDAGVTPDSEENPFGCVSDGFLKLEGLALRCAFDEHPHFKSSSSSAAKVVIKLKTQERIMVSVGLMNDHHRHLAALPPVWVFLICFCPRENAYVQDHFNIFGVLILEEDLRENVFRRLAYKNVPMTEADWDDAERKVVIVK